MLRSQVLCELQITESRKREVKVGTKRAGKCSVGLNRAGLSFRLPKTKGDPQDSEFSLFLL